MKKIIDSPKDSTTIENYIYESELKVLRINFKSGSTYDYKDVDSKTFYNFVNDGGGGTSLNKNIKGNFDYEKIEIKNLD
jgi:hypothetical protein